MTDRRAPATFSISAAWDDAVAMLRTNAGLLTAIAGVFIFLPTLLVARYVPEPAAAGPDLAVFMQTMSDYYGRAWPWLLLGTLANMIGVIAIYLLLLKSPRLTVGAAVGRALPILPFYFVVAFVTNLALFAGFLLFIVPFVFLLGRLVLAGPVLTTEQPTAPFTALQRSWELSRGRGWGIALLIILVYLGALLLSFAITRGVGSIALLALGGAEGIGGLVVAILEALMTAAIALVTAVLVAAIYRATTARVDLGKTFN